MSERMREAIEYRDLLLEILDLRDQVFGKTEEPQDEPAPEEKKPAKKTVKVDKGRIIALAKAGWKRKDIAEDAKCSEATVYAVLKEAKE